jgi:hypothetical protein
MSVSVTNCIETINLQINIGENKSEALRKKWSMVANRLDLMLLVIFFVANAIICVWFLVVGNSKLND